MKIRIYYERTSTVRPWTVRLPQDDGGWHHTPASEVIFEVPSKTEYDPNGGAQKGFMLAEGELIWEPNAVARIVPSK